jgi:HEAT repeat protein
MIIKISTLVQVRRAAVSLILSGLGFSCLAALWSPLAQTQTTSERSAAPTSGSLAIVATTVKNKTIRFGTKLDVFVTLQNQSSVAITIPPDALLLKNKGWTGFPGGGSGLGEAALTRVDAQRKEAFTLQSGDSVILTGSNSEMAAKTLGPMKATFIIETENPTLRQQLANPVAFSVTYEVAPSILLSSVWAAQTAEERQRLQPQIREVLLLASKENDWRDRFYVEGTMTYMGGYAVPHLEAAMKDSDAVVREQAVKALARTAWAASQLNAFIDDLLKKNAGRGWIDSVRKGDETIALQESIRLAIVGLRDGDPRVRIAAIEVLTYRAKDEVSLRRSLANSPRRLEAMEGRERQIYESIGLVDPALPLVQKMADDTAPDVRSAAQKFLANFASQQAIASNIVASLGDPNAKVREQALQALKSSQEAPPVATIEKAFAAVKGEEALGLIDLLFEKEDSGLATTLSPGFKERTPQERLKILTAIAGHTDEAALKLVILGLNDGDNRVRRAALLRLLGFPAAKALPLMKPISTELSPEVRDVAMAVQKELESRLVFPFLARGDSSARESIFPSKSGTGPMVSPDGKWLAYVETGWGRPGGSGGMGRSNLLSITHLVSIDGYADRIVSDMFLVGWMSDSRRLASARDGFAAIVDLNGKIVSEFGNLLEKPYRGGGIDGEVWPSGEVRHQFGVRMPHTKSFQEPNQDSGSFASFDYGEDAASSPDGKWFGPRRVKDKWQFVDAEGNKVEMKAPEDASFEGGRAIWSPDGASIVIVPLHASNSLGERTAIKSRKALVIDFIGRQLKAVIEMEQVLNIGGWDYRKGRCNPWSKDGKRLTFVRQGQIWIADADGSNARQLTFDASNKVFPTFSPDGTKIAYITWQFDNRERHPRLGPTDIWIVETTTGLAARVTQPASARIESLDWLSNEALICDRLEPGERGSTLRTIALR